MKPLKWIPFFLVFSLWASASWGQCTVGCTINIAANATPPTIAANSVVCITGNRTNDINIGNSNNVTIRVSGTFSGQINYTSTNRITIEICGSGVFNRNLTLNNTLSSFFINPGSTYSGNLTVNNGSVTNNGTRGSGTLVLSNSSSYTNSGTSSGTITLNGSSTFTNSGTHTGNLALNNTSRLTNSGTLNLSLLTIQSGSLGITNTATGTIIVDQEQDLSINAPFNNAGIFRFIDDDVNVIIPSGITVTNTGTFDVARNLDNEGTFNSSQGTLVVGRDLINDGNGVLTLGNTTVARDFINDNLATTTGFLSVGRDLINEDGATLNLGNTSVARDFINEELVTITGSIEIGDDLRNGGSAIIRPLNTNQCNTIYVDDTFENNNTNGITGSNLSGSFKAPLLVNKASTPRGIIGNAIIDPTLDCSCASSFTNSGSFTVPAGVTQITLKGWGGGGKGGDRISSSGRSGGGGAGAYSEITIQVTPGEILYYASGQGSSTTAAGGDSWISRASNGSNPILIAKGGNSVANNTSSGASGGLASQGIGTVRTNGGNGSNAGSEDGGDGGNSPNGGNGGNGGEGDGNRTGSNGNNPGGGGGGAKTNGNNTQRGGNGGNGQISFIYSCNETVEPPTGNCWRYIDDGTASGIVIIEFFEDCNWSAPEGLLEFEVLAIGGGGGGGVRSGGGGGGGGAVHARALVGNRLTLGLPAGASFPISVGNGGRGSTNRNNPGENGTQSSFDQGGYYEIIAGSGGGGGSDGEEDNDDDDNDDDDGDENDRIMNRAARNGNPGSASSFRASSIGFSIVSSALYGGSGGGGGHSGAGGNANFRNGGNANRHSGGGGGGLGGNNGANAVDEERGGNGANGIQFSTFDISLNRFFGAGGGGGSEINHLANGGNSGAGGNGGLNDDEDATNGGNAITPGSGGGGSGHDDNTIGGNGAKGVVFVRYEIARILPVEFLYFKAEYNSMTRSGDLNWSTAQEWENDRFEIERSVNTVKDWETIGQLQGAGYSDSPVAYDFQDRKLPLSGGNIFYRLKQVDFNGKATYSDTKAIKVEAAAGTTFWRVYPNPTNGQPFHIERLNNLSVGDEKVTLRAIAPTGQFQVFEVNNIPGMGAQVTEWFKTQAAGIYTLEITWGEKREYHKVILNR